VPAARSTPTPARRLDPDAAGDALRMPVEREDQDAVPVHVKRRAGEAEDLGDDAELEGGHAVVGECGYLA